MEFCEILKCQAVCGIWAVYAFVIENRVSDDDRTREGVGGWEKKFMYWVVLYLDAL